MGEVRESTGRNHHIDAFTMWMAGGGFRPGPSTVRPMNSASAHRKPGSCHDLRHHPASAGNCRHERLSVRFQGLDFRLTG